MWALGVLIGAALGFMTGGELWLLEAILGGAAGWMLDRKPKKEQLNELEKRRAEAERQPEAELGQPPGALQRYRHASRPDGFPWEFRSLASSCSSSCDCQACTTAYFPITSCVNG
jgi:hypothetical protein